MCIEEFSDFFFVHLTSILIVLFALFHIKVEVIKLRLAEHYRITEILVRLMAKSLSNKFFRCLSVCFLVSLEVNHVKSIECGSTQFLRPLIAYGKLTERGEWPFLTALFNVNGSEFFCGGSLISEKHVLTGNQIFFAIVCWN